MKKNRIATAAFTALTSLIALAASPAFAQSSVTLYGVLDEGIDYTNNAGHGAVWEMVSGYAQGSRWGMKGSEDLGGGLKAVFQLENGFDVSSARSRSVASTIRWSITSRRPRPTATGPATCSRIRMTTTTPTTRSVSAIA
jgi:hypothetical protein